MSIDAKEKAQLDKAGAAGGAYLDRLNKYDLRTLTSPEWDEFVKTICVEFFLPF